MVIEFKIDFHEFDADPEIYPQLSGGGNGTNYLPGGIYPAGREDLEPGKALQSGGGILTGG